MCEKINFKLIKAAVYLISVSGETVTDVHQDKTGLYSPVQYLPASQLVSLSTQPVGL